MMTDIIKRIRERASQKQKKIVLSEISDPRVLKAGGYLAEEGLCDVIFVGDRADIESRAGDEGLSLPDKIEYLSPHSCGYLDKLVNHLYSRRKQKGTSREEAAEMLENPLYFGAGLVALDRADGCVAGSVATTGEVIRAAIHTIGLHQDREIVSSTFLMALKGGRVLTYADCSVVPYPNSEQLADIVVESSRTHQLLTEERAAVAMLSFSTKGSAKHKQTKLVTDALKRVQGNYPDLMIDGELQFDAAFVPEVARRKAPDSRVAGKANVMIFPNLDAGNIAYKITERLGGATATGPILQGLAKPMMDLSRGCNWQDIVNAACVAVLMGERRDANTSQA